MLKVAIIGVTGYGGEELVRILLKHPDVSITSVSAKIDRPTPLIELYPDFKGKLDLVCTEPDLEDISKKADVIFLALPHTVSMSLAPLFLKKGKIVIDLSADYRLEAAVYEKYYKVKHTDIDNIKLAVYGLPEINRKFIAKAKLIANPGCYPTAALLSLLPLLKNNINLESIYIDAKSGTSGAGRNPNLKLDEFIRNQNMKAYKVNVHQHAPEINSQLKKLQKNAPNVVFVPHLIPIERGILETIYVKLATRYSLLATIKLYQDFYKDEPFVKILNEGEFPVLKDVIKTNYCHIGIKQEKNLMIIVSVIDNLVKGASGQAIQNMNISCGFKETEGII
ncbi:MAG: N-acetyl-gamma-glutamyl-phosphate reductase [Candidatus Omnitrophota bacterium]